MNKAIIKDVLSFYYDLNGESHGYKHLDEVYELATKINKDLDLGLPDDVIMVSSYCHDMFSNINRELHHELGYKYVKEANTYFLNNLDHNDRHLVACAVREHRASYSGEYTSVLSELLSAADRGTPDIKKTVWRAYMYSKETLVKVKEDITKLGVSEIKLGVDDMMYCMEKALEHLKDKYSSNGYARYNDLYRKYFKDELEDFLNFFDNITINEVKTIVTEIKNEKNS